MTAPVAAGSPVPALDPGALAVALKEAGPGLDEAGLRRLLTGVAGAPPGADPDGWMRLVADRPSPSLVAALRLLHQSLIAPARPLPGPADRLGALRLVLAARGLDGFLVPHADEQQNEYIPPRAERLAWLTGFTGSAGLAIVLKDRAA
ncbi:MAG: aminopeptidase P family N-terminal domain-containing protein, partial [Dongiaceae bacterium]